MKCALPDMPAPFRYVIISICLGNIPTTNKLNPTYLTGEQRLIRQKCDLFGLGIFVSETQTNCSR